jgi:hypothetical protein
MEDWLHPGRWVRWLRLDNFPLANDSRLLSSSCALSYAPAVHILETLSQAYFLAADKAKRGSGVGR